MFIIIQCSSLQRLSAGACSSSGPLWHLATARHHPPNESSWFSWGDLGCLALEEQKKTFILKVQLNEYTVCFNEASPGGRRIRQVINYWHRSSHTWVTSACLLLSMCLSCYGGNVRQDVCELRLGMSCGPDATTDLWLVPPEQKQSCSVEHPQDTSVLRFLHSPRSINNKTEVCLWKSPGGTVRGVHHKQLPSPETCLYLSHVFSMPVTLCWVWYFKPVF